MTISMISTSRRRTSVWNSMICLVTTAALMSMYIFTTIDAFPILIQYQQPMVTSTSPTMTTSRRGSTQLYAVEKRNNNFLDNIFSSFTSAVANKEAILPPSKPKYENVIIAPDYRIAGLFSIAGVFFDTIPYLQWTIGPFLTLLGILFFVQTLRIRFVFTEDNQFELKTVSPSFGGSNTENGQEVSALRDSGENVIVGGANCWDCDTIVNYDFFPRNMMDLPFFEQPVLIYFKETQTPESTWNEGPGKVANDPDKVANGSAIPGQVHFFPAICNAKQIEQEFQKRNVQKL